MICTYEHALTAANPNPPQRSEPDPPTSWRGQVVGFSSRSRRRLLRLLSTVRTSQLPEARFVTLTWHRVPDRWHADVLAFRQYIRRRGGQYIWRLEAQERGAPHYHLIVWCDDWDSGDARATWHRIAAHGSEAHAEHGYDEQPMEAYAQIFAYVAKYLAKRDRALPAELQGHRIWGASRDLPTTATAASDQLTESQYYALRRFARRLYRARLRAKSGRVSGRGRNVSPASLHLYLRRGDPERICNWLGVDLVDPLWTDAGADDLADAFARPPPAPPVWWHRGQASAFGPWGAQLN